MSTLREGSLVLLLASYCGDEDKECNERNPCDCCLSMCNTFRLYEGAEVTYEGEFGGIGSQTVET